MTLVVFISHIANQFTLDRYNDIKRSLLNNYKLVWLYTNDSISEEWFKEHHIELTYNCHTPKNYWFGKLPNNNYLFIDLYKNFSNFEYYWFIEYDVMINTKNNKPFYKLFSYFEYEKLNHTYKYLKFYKSVKYDLIASHINNYITRREYDYVWRYEKFRKYEWDLDKLGIIKKNFYFGFFPVCRMSNRLLNTLCNEKDFHSIFFEFAIPTLAVKYDYLIQTLDNIFVYDNQMYFDDPNQRINNGSNSWYAKKYQEYWNKYPEYTIIHPVKSYDK